MGFFIENWIARYMNCTILTFLRKLMFIFEIASKSYKVSKFQASKLDIMFTKVSPPAGKFWKCESLICTVIWIRKIIQALRSSNTRLVFLPISRFIRWKKTAVTQLEIMVAPVFQPRYLRPAELFETIKNEST